MVVACCSCLLALPCIRLVFSITQLNSLPRAGAKEIEWNVQSCSLSAVDHRNEPLLPGPLCFGNHLARFTARKNQSLVPNGGNGRQYIPRWIFDVALRMAAEAQEGRRETIAWASSCAQVFPISSLVVNTVGV